MWDSWLGVLYRQNGGLLVQVLDWPRGHKQGTHLVNSGPRWKQAWVLLFPSFQDVSQIRLLNKIEISSGESFQHQQ